MDIGYTTADRMVRQRDRRMQNIVYEMNESVRKMCKNEVTFFVLLLHDKKNLMELDNLILCFLIN